jgi:hypothetical protein
MCCYKDDIMTHCDSKSVSNMFSKPGNDKISLAVAVFYRFLNSSLIVTDLRKHLQFYHVCHVVSEQNAVDKNENDLCVPTRKLPLSTTHTMFCQNDMQMGEERFAVRLVVVYV